MNFFVTNHLAIWKTLIPLVLGQFAQALEKEPDYKENTKVSPM